MRGAQIRPEEIVRLDHTEYGLRVLRYRGVVELAWVGCGDEEIAVKGGHATEEMIRKNAVEPRHIMRARQAREKRQ